MTFDFGSIFIATLSAAVPAVIQVVKTFAPKIPKVILPVAAPLLGLGLSYLGSVVIPALSAINPFLGALAGAVGVVGYDFFRELNALNAPPVAPPVVLSPSAAPPAPPADARR